MFHKFSNNCSGALYDPSILDSLVIVFCSQSQFLLTWKTHFPRTPFDTDCCCLLCNILLFFYFYDSFLQRTLCSFTMQHTANNFAKLLFLLWLQCWKPPQTLTTIQGMFLKVGCCFINLISSKVPLVKLKEAEKLCQAGLNRKPFYGGSLQENLSSDKTPCVRKLKSPGVVFCPV